MQARTLGERLRGALTRWRKKAAVIDRHTIRASREWALDEETGVFACYSSFGTYAYCWNHIGKQTLKEFLRELDFDYFMGKTRPAYRRFDADATIEGIKERIIEERRLGSLSKDEAREAWNDLGDINYIDPHEFLDAFTASKALMSLYGGDYYDIARERPDGDSRGFWRVIWPELLKQITPATVAA